MAAASTMSPTPPPKDWYNASDDDDDDDDDEVNTAGARIFFGALKSPELKFAHLHTPKPLRKDDYEQAVSPLVSLARHAPDTRAPTTAHEPAANSSDLISFDTDCSTAHALQPDVGDDIVQNDLLDATMVLDAPPLSPETQLAPVSQTPSHIPLPTSPLTAEDEMQVEVLLTPKRQLPALAAQEAQVLSDVPAAAQEQPETVLLAIAEPVTQACPTDQVQDQSIHFSVSFKSPLGERMAASPTPVPPGALDIQALAQLVPQTPTHAAQAPPLSMTPRGLTTSLISATPAAPQTPAHEDGQQVLNVSVSLSPTRLQTPKRKHGDAFPGAQVAVEVRKKPFGAPRLAPAAAVKDAPRKPAPAPRKPAPRPPMLGSLSPETDGVLSRLLAPSTSSGAQQLNVNINIDFTRMPSLGAGAATLAKENDLPGVPSTSPARTGSPKRVPISVIFRSPSPPRRVLISSPARLPSPSPPPKDAARKPAGLMATRTPLPFPIKAALPSPQRQHHEPQSSPVKPVAGSSQPAAAAKPSQLRQPTVRAASRLPKPKPYSAPPSKAPAPTPAASKTALPLPTRSAKGFGATKVVPSPPHAPTTAPPPQASPIRAQGPIMIRQVIPGMLGGKNAAKDVAAQRIRSNFASVVASSPTRNRSQDAPATHERAPIPIRQVIPGTLRHYEGRPTTTPPPAPSVSLAPAFSFLSNKRDATPTTAATYEPPPSPSPPPRMRTPPSDIVLPVAVLRPAPDQPASEPAPVRRTARVRAKPVASSSAGAVVVGRATPVADDFLPQGPQLRALTTANTLRNQAWSTTSIETLIVRKPGPRPASPSTKMRTAAEKRKEEAGRERERRARRRAGEEAEAEEEARRRTHLKGPGDESEYETPDAVRVAGRGVRWDPELISTPERRGEDDEPVLPRSCLTPAPNKAGIPLHAVRREKVVVTKFVYDDDDEAVVEPVLSSSEPELVIPTALKAKGRKKKLASNLTSATPGDA